MKEAISRESDSRTNSHNYDYNHKASSLPNSKGATVQKKNSNSAAGSSALPIAQFKSEDSPISRFYAMKAANSGQTTIQKKENNTGLPDNLKSGVENLSGYSMDEVKVHYNSDKPARLQAHAYAQGTDIHVAPGQEKHLPHEAWHVVQQKQGRVKPTLQMKTGMSVNDDTGLEHEADIMGMKALSSGQMGQQGNQKKTAQLMNNNGSNNATAAALPNGIIQMVKDMNSAYGLGAKRGSGLTQTQIHQEYGKWHLHVISDKSQLGLIERIFIRFEEEPLGAQHLMINRNGKRIPLALSGTGDPNLVEWGYQQLEAFLDLCDDVSFLEIKKRRENKQKEELRKLEEEKKLPSRKEPSKHNYTNGLFGNTNTAVSEEDALDILSKAGIDNSNRDFNMIKVKVKDNAPKDKWPGLIRQYYDQIYPPIIAEIMEMVDEEIVEEEIKENDSVHQTVVTTEIIEKGVEQVQEKKPVAETQNILKGMGLPITLIMIILAIIWAVFFR